MSSVSNKLDYKLRDFSHPKYKLHQVSQQNGGSNVLITPAGGQESVFEIPAKVFNLSKCRLRGFLYVPSPGVGVTRNNYLYNSQLSLISEIQLYNAGGTMVCDLKYANVYTDVVSKPETTMNEFLSNGNGLIETNFLHRNDSFFNAIDSKRYNNTNATLNFTEHQYYKVVNGNIGDPIAVPPILPFGEEINQAFNIKLSDYKNTIFSVDKDLYFGETMFLRIKWSPTTRIGWTSQFIINQGVIGYNPNVNPQVFNQNMTVNSLQFYLACEDDPIVQNAIISQFASGMNVRIPYVWSSKTSLTGTNQNVTIRLSTAHGRRLKKIYHAFYNPNENSNTAYDHGNVGGLRCERYFTLINNSRRQEFDINPSTFDDYMINKKRFENSVIQDVGIFLYNYFVLDDFTEDDCVDSSNNKQILGLDCGLPITSDLKWDIACQVPNVLANNQLQNHYSFAIVSRDLHLSPGVINFY